MILNRSHEIIMCAQEVWYFMTLLIIKLMNKSNIANAFANSSHAWGKKTCPWFKG